MANHNSKHSPAPFPRIRRNTTGTHETSATRSKINKSARKYRNSTDEAVVHKLVPILTIYHYWK